MSAHPSAPAHDLEALLTRFVEARELEGVTLDPADLCRDRPDLLSALEALIQAFETVSVALDGGSRPIGEDGAAASVDRVLLPAPPSVLPTFDGFRTIERLGAGGMGEVYKLQDLTLDRIVAAKVVRPDGWVPAGMLSTLDEARSLALFQDPRIVQIYEYRPDGAPPAIIMEYVEGFELGRLAPSLEYHQRARILREVCDAVHHAHSLGVQHRDLKPSNIMLDAALMPKILDFGLSERGQGQRRFVGTPAYLAPEQLDAEQSLDARTDVYGLGAVLYEVLCQAPPHTGTTADDVLESVRRGQPRFPVEIEPRVPEALQAIALKALERHPAQRYQTAREMALDLDRYLEGRPVTARPTQYGSELAARVAVHLQQIQEWLRIRLVYPHEAASLARAYGQLDAREDDWIVASRSLSYSQIALYLGAFFLIAGSLFYFTAHRFHDAVRGMLRPFLVLAVPFIGLNITAHYLGRREHRAVSVAFYLAGVSLLPLFLLILFYETGLWVLPEGTHGQLFQGGEISNRQLQVTVLAACAWAGWLAFRTRTAALSTVFALLVFLFWVSALTDAGLRTWLEDGRYDRLALHLAPLAAAFGALGLWQVVRRAWFGRPFVVGAVLLLITSLELLALDGRAFNDYLGLSLRHFSPGAADPVLLDTLAAMTLNGGLFYLTGWLVERFGPDAARPAAALLFVVAPFAVLEPVGYLSKTGQYALGWDWSYLALALSIALLSHQRQRRGFYYAGVLNAAVALFLIADHRDWFGRPWWAMALVASGLGVLLAGYALAALERRRRR